MMAKRRQQVQGSKVAVAKRMISRPGSQRRARNATCRAQSVSVLWRRPRSRQYRADGASTVGNGKAQTRPAQVIGASSIRLSQRSPEVLTKKDFDARTGSR
jgi:hypothetical protein